MTEVRLRMLLYVWCYVAGVEYIRRGADKRSDGRVWFIEDKNKRTMP